VPMYPSCRAEIIDPDSDTILTGIVTFDDRDVGVANLFLDSLSEIFEVLTALLEKRRDRHTTHTRR